MFFLQLKLIFRSFLKSKTSFLINVLSLSTGLCCALLIYLWVEDEATIDGFHNSQVYQLMQNEHLSDVVNTVEGTPGILAQNLKEDFPQVSYAVTTSPAYWLAESKVFANAGKTINAAGKFAGKDFFDVFNFPLLQGRKDNVLADKNAIVISEALAIKLFNTSDAVGKEITWTNTELQSENKGNITGIFKNTDARSSEQFDFLISAEVMLDAAGATYRKWNNYGPSTYVLLKPGTNLKYFNETIKGYLKAKGVENSSLFAVPYSDNYLYNNFKEGKVSGGRIEYVRLFSLIAVFILLLACINFMNLSTARSTKRLKEVGVKKVIGASRAALKIQFLTESVLISTISMFLALLLAELLLPNFNAITGKNLSLVNNLNLIALITIVTIITGVISGIYPAVHLSGFMPSRALKGISHQGKSTITVRQGLVFFQFAISITLIVGVLVVSKQIEYVQNTSQGFDRENVIYFEADGQLKNNAELASAEIGNLPGVMNVTSVDREILGDLSYTTGAFNWEVRDSREVVKFQRADVGLNFTQTLGIKILEGRTFSDENGSDSLKIIINEAGIKTMRMKNPVGKTFTLWGTNYQIIGVMKDFHFESMHKAIGPMFIRFKPEHTNRIFVKIASMKLKETIDAIKEKYALLNPKSSFYYKFLDQDFQRQYNAELRVSALSKYFAVLAIFISCIGLFGLATFTVERRFKEIGIRKVLGANTGQMIFSLSKDFLKPVVVSVIFSLPLSYLLSRYWLDNFAYRIELKFWFFAFSGLAAVLISWLTIGMQAIRAASINPVDALKSE
ncbi:ABC transporter permease [Pedobacter sp.]|uniref:ABC transporter permease n=1 Tax=Pedobacter sp. TaxID=1411316 RepID=UPI003BABA8E7